MSKAPIAFGVAIPGADGGRIEFSLADLKKLHQTVPAQRKDWVWETIEALARFDVDVINACLEIGCKDIDAEDIPDDLPLAVLATGCADALLLRVHGMTAAQMQAANERDKPRLF